jgi:hypothetical protein
VSVETRPPQQVLKPTTKPTAAVLRDAMVGNHATGEYAVNPRATV